MKPTPLAIPPAGQLAATFFNTFSLHDQGHPLPVHQLRAKLQSVLAYLLYRHPQVVRCEQLNEQFWPHTFSNNSAFNAISGLRRWARPLLPAPFILTTRAGNAYRINPDYRLTTDARQLQQLLHRSQQQQPRQEIEALLEKTLACYRGRFGQDLTPNEWCLAPGYTAEEQLIGIFRYASQQLRQYGDHQTVIDWGLRIMQFVTPQEEVYYQLALAYQQGGWESQARRQLLHCREALRQQGETCSTRLRQLEQQLSGAPSWSA